MNGIVPPCPKPFDRKVEIEEYLIRDLAAPHMIRLFDLYMRASRFLPGLRGKRIYVVPFDTAMHPRGAVGFVCRDPSDENTFYVGFKEDPPDELTLLHELIHVAGGDELHAYCYSLFLLYALDRGLPPFNLFDLERLTLDDVKAVLGRFGLKSVEEYFEVVGVVPTAIAELVYAPEGPRIRLREDADEDLVVQTFLAELAGSISIWYTYHVGQIGCKVFEEIARMLARSGSKEARSVRY